MRVTMIGTGDGEPIFTDLCNIYLPNDVALQDFVHDSVGARAHPQDRTSNYELGRGSGAVVLIPRGASRINRRQDLRRRT